VLVTEGSFVTGADVSINCIMLVSAHTSAIVEWLVTAVTPDDVIAEYIIIVASTVTNSKNIISQVK